MSHKPRNETKDLKKGEDSPTINFINHESRIAKLESTIDNTNCTLTRLESKMDNNFSQINGRFEKIDNKIDSFFIWRDLKI